MHTLLGALPHYADILFLVFILIEFRFSQPTFTTRKIMKLTIFTRSLVILLIVGPFFFTANGFFFDKLERFKKFTLPGYVSNLGIPGLSGLSSNVRI